MRKRRSAPSLCPTNPNLATELLLRASQDPIQSEV